jgi:hypothetical protein
MPDQDKNNKQSNSIFEEKSTLSFSREQSTDKNNIVFLDEYKDYENLTKPDDENVDRVVCAPLTPLAE